MIRYKITRPMADGPERTYESKTLSSLPGNLTQYWVVVPFENREKLADLLVVDDNTLVAGPTKVIWKLSALVLKEQWRVIEQYHVTGGRGWTFRLERGSEHMLFEIRDAVTLCLDAEEVVPLQSRMKEQNSYDKKNWLNAAKLARQLNPSINTEDGQLRCRLEQVEGELELLAEERVALVEAIGRCEEGSGHDAVEAAKRQ